MTTQNKEEKEEESSSSYKFSYETLWKAIIRPPRDDYDCDQLGESIFTYHKVTYIRHDYNILNTRGNILKCSFLEALIDMRHDYIMPVVVYLHGNSSSRIEGLKSAPELLKHGINIFTFDFSGCGQSEGEYISLGWHERNDVRTVIDFVEKLPGVGNIGIWGRSMGAATTMLYAHSDPRIKAICMDSPFGVFDSVAKDLCNQFVKLPDFLLDFAMKLVKNTIKDKNQFDIDNLKPINYADKTHTPAFFVHAVNDQLISLEQTLKLYEDYKGKKTLNVVEGGHNSCRQRHVLEKIAIFFSKYLRDEDPEHNEQYKNVNTFYTASTDGKYKSIDDFVIQFDDEDD